MANFRKALNLVIYDETGRYLDDPNNHGAYNDIKGDIPTKWGITIIDMQEWHRRPVSKEEVKAMPLTLAMDIYEKKYWNVMLGDEIQDQRSANAIFNQVVNRGLGYIRTLQDILGVTRDGHLGPKTLEAINKMPAEVLITKIAERAEKDYKRIAERKPEKKKFLRGWILRARRLLALIKWKDKTNA
jgi:lysozyme family protein